MTECDCCRRLGPGPYYPYRSKEEYDKAQAERVQKIIDAVKRRKMVRAKFKVDSFEIFQSQKLKAGATLHKAYDPNDYEKVEIRSVKMFPVYGNSDPNHENTKFWQASPSGSLTLGTINPEAWKHFELGKEYYIDFTLAE